MLFCRISIPSVLLLSWDPVCVLRITCLTFFNPVDCSPPGSSLHEIFRARVLEWVAMPSSSGTSPSRDWTCAPCIAGGFFTNELGGRRNTTRTTGLKWDRYRCTYFSLVNPTKLKRCFRRAPKKKKKRQREELEKSEKFFSFECNGYYYQYSFQESRFHFCNFP